MFDALKEPELKEINSSKPPLIIGIIDPNGYRTLIDVSQFEMIIELREFLRDYLKTCLFTNYYFELKGERLNDFQEFKDLKLQPKRDELEIADGDTKSSSKQIQRPGNSDINFYMKHDSQELTEQNITTHQQSMRKSSQGNNGKDNHADSKLNSRKESLASEISSSCSNDEYSMFRNGMQQNDNYMLNDDILFMRYLWGNQAQAKNSYNRFGGSNPLALLKRGGANQFYHQKMPFQQLKEKIQVPKVSGARSISTLGFTDLNNLLGISMIPEKNGNSNNETDNCDIKKYLQHISFEVLDKQNNDMSNQFEQMGGMLFNLKVIVEQEEYIVHACEAGFAYKNNNQSIMMYSQTFSGLLCQMSHKLKVQFGKHLKNLCKLDPYKALSKDCGMTDYNQSTNWFKTYSQFHKFKEEQKYKEQDLVSEKSYESGIYGLNYRHGVVREWNEEYQQQETCDETVPTFQTANADLKGIQRVEKADIPGLYILATCIVKYMGFRVVCQSIIPGILSFVQQEIISEYGSSNNCKNVDTNPEYHKLMITLCQQLNLASSVRVIENSSIIKEIAGSPEIKGVRGTDKKKYLIDLMRIHPRDANYKDIVKESTCVMREELIRKFILMDKVKKEQEKQKQEEERGQNGQYNSNANKNIGEEDVKERNIAMAEAIVMKKNIHYSSVEFNTNLYTNIPLESQNEEEMSVLENLSTYLKDKAIESLIEDTLFLQEGGPTDSISLSNSFHSHGVNMRYLGYVLSRFKELCLEKDLKFKHIEFLLEKEIFVRCIKHQLGIFISESLNQQQEQSQFIVIHALNCIFSSHLLLDLLNEKVIQMDQQYIAQSQDIQTLKFGQENNQEINTKSSAYAPEKKEEKGDKSNQKQQLSQKKKQKRMNKKMAKNKNKQLKKELQFEECEMLDNLNGQVTDQSKQEISTIGVLQNNDQLCDQSTTHLTWSNQSTPNHYSSRKGSHFELLSNDSSEKLQKIVDDLKQTKFSIDSMCLKSKDIFDLLKSTCSTLNESLSITPSALFQMLASIAEARYKHQFQQQDFQTLWLLQSTSNKYSILREICIALGITIEARDYHLENQQNFCISQNPTYSWLPFQSFNVLEFTPSTKQVNHFNPEIEKLVLQGNSFFKQCEYEQAFDCYAQCVSVYAQLQGPLSKEAYDSLQRMARIMYIQGDIVVAIELQTKVIQMSISLFGGLDNVQTAYSMTALALYFQQIQESEKCFNLIEKALDIFAIVEGENHPDIAASYMTLGYLFQETDLLYEALDSFLEALYRFVDLIGEESIQVSSCHSAIAVTYFHLDELKTALNHQEKSHAILLRLSKKCKGLGQLKQLKQIEQYIESSTQLISYYTGCCIAREKAIKLNQQQMGTRQCKRAMGRSNGAGGPQQQMFPPNLNFLDFLEYNKFLQSTLDSKQQ